MMRRVRSNDAAETEALAAELARTLAPGDVVLLSGELGAGKTTFVRGAARELGVAGPITSPSFALGSRYSAAEVTVSHLDLYRLADLDEEDPDLLADYIGPHSISFIEWPGTGVGEIARLGTIRYRVNIEHAGADDRILTVSNPEVELEIR